MRSFFLFAYDSMLNLARVFVDQEMDVADVLSAATTNRSTQVKSGADDVLFRTEVQNLRRTIATFVSVGFGEGLSSLYLTRIVFHMVQNKEFFGCAIFTTLVFYHSRDDRSARFVYVTVRLNFSSKFLSAS